MTERSEIPFSPFDSGFVYFRGEVFPRILKGSTCFLLGRKGSGKSFILENLSILFADQGDKSSTLDFEHFFENFSRLFLQLRNNDAVVREFESFWQLVLLGEKLKHCRNNDLPEGELPVVNALLAALPRLRDPTDYWNFWLLLIGRRFRPAKTIARLGEGLPWGEITSNTSFFKGILSDRSVDYEYDIAEASSYLARSAPNSSLVMFDGINAYSTDSWSSIDERSRSFGIDKTKDIDVARVRIVRDFFYVVRHHVSEARAFGYKKAPVVLAGIETNNLYWLRMVGKETNKAVSDYGVSLDAFNRSFVRSLGTKELKKYYKELLEKKNIHASKHEVERISYLVVNLIRQHIEIFELPKNFQRFDQSLVENLKSRHSDNIGGDIGMAVASALEQTAEVSKVEIFYQLKAVLSDEELTLVGDFLEDCGQNREGRFSVSRFFRDMPAFQERGSTIQKHEIVDLLEQVGFLRLDRSIGPMVSASYFSPRTERYKGVLA